MEMTYEEFINNILETRGRFACGEEYHERHHIVPKCMGGTNEEENLIDLFAREHFEAHKLLALENPENEKLVHAWVCMTWFKTGNQERVKVSAAEYEEAKKYYSKMRSENLIGENNYFYGKHHSEETKEKLRQLHLGKKMLDETKDKIREANHNRVITQETREKLKKINLGIKRSETTTKKISETKKGLYISENNPN